MEIDEYNRSGHDWRVMYYRRMLSGMHATVKPSFIKTTRSFASEAISFGSRDSNVPLQLQARARIDPPRKPSKTAAQGRMRRDYSLNGHGTMLEP